MAIINEVLLAKVKTSLRISHTALDTDVTDSIEAGVNDLRVCGILDSKLDTTQDLDPLILNAVKLYCKAEYTDDPVKAARYQQSYDALKSSLKMAEGYGWEEATDD